MPRHTHISIQGPHFHINGAPTFAGRRWRGCSIEGLLPNLRVVQGIFDDLNPQTREQWAYPDTQIWDAQRNTREFIAAMPAWRAHGLAAISLNLQGGSPFGYSKSQPWINSAFTETGELRPAYMKRLEQILNRADELGICVILGLFYFGQDHRLQDECAVRNAVDNATNWVLGRDYRNVIIEINNECNHLYTHPILMAERVHKLIQRVAASSHGGRRLLVGTSFGGGKIPNQSVVRAFDFLLMHSNIVSDPNRIAEMVRQTREITGYRPMPIGFNEDDHFNFDEPHNNMKAALSEGASWGFFDYRRQGESFDEGYQSVPVNWGISSARKREFFDLLGEMTGAKANEK